MSYDFGRAAGDTLDILRIRLCGNEYTNRWEEGGKKYFFELGKEQDDGAITGSIWVHTRTENERDYYKRSSTFRIEPNGHLARGPRSWKAALKDREQELKNDIERNRYVTREWHWYRGSEVLTALRREATA